MTRPERTSRRALAAISALTTLVVVAALLVASSTRPSSAAPMTWSAAPSAATGNELDSVSCASPPRCVAVGYLETPGGIRRTLAQTTTDSSWAVMPTTNQGSRNNALAGVSCPDVAYCVAVGSFDSGAGPMPLIETWNGTAWSTTPSPSPGVNGGQLGGVSCATVTSCVAVGFAANSAGHVQPLVEIWNGTVWAITPAPTPSTNRDATLASVSCPTVTNCIAVGSAHNSAGHLRTLVEAWDGTAWTTTASPNPGTQSDAVLAGVSCPTTSYCVAVGSYDNGIGVHATLAELWTGTTWQTAKTVDPSSRGSYLRGVSCRKVGMCIAVGWSGTDNVGSTLVEVETGTKWAVSTTPPDGYAESRLMSASCGTASRCVAVGRVATGSSEHSLALNGSTTPDVTPPAISISAPADGGYYVVGQTVHAAYACTDETGGSGTALCVGTQAAGATIDTSAAGTGTFSVSSADYAENTASATSHYRVVEPASASATAPANGASITTDPGSGPTPELPVATTLTSSDAGALAIDQGAVTLIPPAGLDVLGVEVDTIAPPPSTATPLTLTFDADAAFLPSGTSPGSLALLHDAALVPDCDGATTLPAGVQACISHRGNAPSGGGDLRLTALSASAGTWNLATGAASPPRVDVAGGAVVEGNSGTHNLAVRVSLAQPSALPASVDFATSDLSARAGSDYDSTAGSLTFLPGERAKIVPVTVNGDTKHESNETFAVTLSSPSGSTLGDAGGVETIADDDPIAPAAPVVTAFSSAALAQLTWTLPASNGAPITAYDVRVYLGTALQSSKSHTVTCTAPCAVPRQWTVTGLANDKRYTFKVSARNSKGSGAVGATTILVTDISNGGVLSGRPVRPQATAGPARVTLTWAPPMNGTGSVTSYTITPYKNGVVQPVAFVTQVERSLVFTNLTPGATYRFTVRPISPVGPGPDSPQSLPVTPT